MIYEVGRSASLQINGDVRGGIECIEVDDVGQAAASLEGTVSATLRQTAPNGWTYGGTVSAKGGVVYLHDTTDPATTDFDVENIDAYGFVETPMLDVTLGRIITQTAAVPEVWGRASLNYVMDTGPADFSTGVTGEIVGIASCHQGLWLATVAADNRNRQHGSIVWRRPVRTITPAYGVEFIRDNAYDRSQVPLYTGTDTGEVQLHGGRFGAMAEYGRLTFGASAGLEALYDGSTHVQTDSLYDVGLSNKSGCYIFGAGVKHRRSNQENVHETALTADMVVGIATGVDLEFGYQFTRLEDKALADPVHTHEGRTNLRLSF